MELEGVSSFQGIEDVAAAPTRRPGTEEGGVPEHLDGEVLLAADQSSPVRVDYRLTGRQKHTTRLTAAKVICCANEQYAFSRVEHLVEGLQRR
jgi:hypothetical protein